MSANVPGSGNNQTWGQGRAQLRLAAWWLGALGLLCPALAAAQGQGDADLLTALQQRQALCPADDLRGRLALARWADDNDLWEQADQIYRQILTIRPQHDEAHAALLAHAEARPLPTESQAYTSARDLLPDQFAEHETRRFVVLSDARTNAARNQAERLERTWHQFHRFARRIGLKPLPLRHRLVCILFASRDDYQLFGRTHDEVTDPWIAGYYSPRYDRVVFYDIESNPSLTRARIKLRQMRARMDRLGNDLDRAEQFGRDEQATSLRHSLIRYQRHLASEQQRVDEFASSADIATTIHEATHQLMFHTGVQSPQLQYPIWICEGLATSFETDSPDEAFGPDHEYAPRRRPFQQVLADDALIELPRLVTITDLTGSRDEQVKTVYHQSYALVTWMSRFRRTELRNYLVLMLKEPPGRPEPQRHLELFEEAFGDVRILQRAWLRHELSLQPEVSAGPITRRLAAGERPLDQWYTSQMTREPAGLLALLAGEAYGAGTVSVSSAAIGGSEPAGAGEDDCGPRLFSGLSWE
ncbi:MAG: DUF1570 domain-containing protein [Phycisphaerales bacterium]|nr:MAG: DUF1570 domain-containing protein [Phycisphaerales bacterium]